MMKLYLVRHGIAVDLGECGVTHDADRMLSKEGWAKTRLAAVGARQAGIHPQIIGSSPLIRAWQTAEIFAEELKPAKPAVERCDFMAFGGREADFFDWLVGQDAQAVMLVGHMPDLVFKTHACVQRGAAVPMTYKKAAVACISFPDEPRPRSGRLEWMLAPKQLREMASNKMAGLDVEQEMERNES